MSAVQAKLFMVDEPLFDRIATWVLGSPLDSDQDVGLLRLVLSCFLSGRQVDFTGLYHGACFALASNLHPSYQAWSSGGKDAFIWSAIHRVASQQKTLVVVCITDAEQTICRHQDRHSAFCSSFLGKDKPEDSPSQPGVDWPLHKVVLSRSSYSVISAVNPCTDSCPSCLLQVIQPCMNRSAPQRQENKPELHPV